MSNLSPSHFIHSVDGLYPSFLEANPYIKGVTWDLDKTLVGQHQYEIPENNMRVLRAFAELGIWQGIVSNAASEERTIRVKRLAADVSKQISGQFFPITSRMVNGKIKPHTAMFELAAHEAGLKPENMCHVGDQIFKDVLGANRAGFSASILVAPYGTGDDWRVRFLQRPVEAAIRPMLHMPMRVKAFPEAVQFL